MCLNLKATLVLTLTMLSCLCAVTDVTLADPPGAKFEIRRAEAEPAEGLTKVTIVGGTRKVYVHNKAELTNDDVSEARAAPDEKERYAIVITFTKEGAKKMAQVTKDHKEKPLAIMVDGKVIAAPVVTSVISTTAFITGNFTKEQAENIAASIKEK
jgi:preprotein translocase subunit SecD